MSNAREQELTEQINALSAERTALVKERKSVEFAKYLGRYFKERVSAEDEPPTYYFFYKHDSSSIIGVAISVAGRTLSVTPGRCYYAPCDEDFVEITADEFNAYALDQLTDILKKQVEN